MKCTGFKNYHCVDGTCPNVNGYGIDCFVCWYNNCKDCEFLESNTCPPEPPKDSEE